MIDHSIIQLDQARPEIASNIHRVMMAAYQVEAELLDVADFVPLRRTAAQIARADSVFLGAFVNNNLAAVAEIEIDPVGPTNIAALVVQPEYFRQGFGKALIRHVVRCSGERDIAVSTGIGNRPALLLYASLQFIDQSRWTTDDGIPMVTLIRRADLAEEGEANVAPPCEARRFGQAVNERA